MDYTSPKAISAKSVVDSGRFELADFLDKLDVLWIQGDISKEEREALTGEARERADPERSMPALAERVGALELRCAAIEEALVSIGGGSGEEPETSEEWPEWVRPTSKDTQYNKGDKVTFEGRRYTCVKNNVTASPAENPKQWKAVEDGEE